MQRASAGPAGAQPAGGTGTGKSRREEPGGCSGGRVRNPPAPDDLAAILSLVLTPSFPSPQPRAPAAIQSLCKTEIRPGPPFCSSSPPRPRWCPGGLVYSRPLKLSSFPSMCGRRICFARLAVTRSCVTLPRMNQPLSCLQITLLGACRKHQRACLSHVRVSPALVLPGGGSAPPGALGVSGDHCGCHTGEPLASSGWAPGDCSPTAVPRTTAPANNPAHCRQSWGVSAQPWGCRAPGGRAS